MCYVKANGNRLDAIANRKDRPLHEKPKRKPEIIQTCTML